MANISDFEKMSQKILSATLTKNDKKFSLKLYKDSNTVVSKT